MSMMVRSMMVNKRSRSASSGAGGGGGVVGFPDAVMSAGMNLGNIFYYNAEPLYVDLIRQSGAAFALTGGFPLAALAADGFPTEDFLFGPTQRLPPDEAFSQTYTMLVDGNAGTVTMETSNYWTLVGSVYNGTTLDTTTITLTGPDRRDQNMEGCILRFTGTKRTPGSSVGSGVRRIRMPRPAYNSTPDRLVTNEFITQVAPFSTIRFMKAMGAETNLSITNYAQYPKRANYGMIGSDPAPGPQLAYHGILPIEDIVAICNACNKNLWLTINGNADGTLGVTSLEYGMAAYIEANLNPGLICIYEYTNETWNFGYQWFAYGVNKAMKEIHGFWNDAVADRGERKLLSAVRAGNTVTCQMNVAHEMTTGQNLSCFISANMGGTVTSIDATHFSFPDINADATLSLTNAGGGITGISNLTTDASDGNGTVVYPSQIIAERWLDRRRVQMSDNIRLAVGGTWGTRHQPVYMTQGATSTLYRANNSKLYLENVLGTSFAAKFSAIGTGAYIFGGDPDFARITTDYAVAHTMQQYVDAYAANINPFSESYYAFDVWKAFCLLEGVKYYAYEFGSDTKMYSFGDLTHYAGNAVALRAATVDIQWKDIEHNFMIEQAKWGLDLGMEFNLEMIPIDIADGAGYWGMTYGSTVSPKQQAYIDYTASPPAMARNVIPGTVDGRAYIYKFGDVSGDPYPRPNSIANYSPFPATTLIYLCDGSDAGVHTIKVHYKTLVATAGHTMTVKQNNATLGVLNFPSLGVGTEGDTATLSITTRLAANNAIQLVRDSAHADFEVRQVIVT